MGAPCRNNSQSGSVLIALIAGMVLMGVLTAGVISFNSTDDMQAVNTIQGDSAYYLAESGLRYAASQYKKIQNENAEYDSTDLSADDEKAAFLENSLDKQTLTLPSNKGTILIDVYPYWFVFAQRGGTVTLKLPGQVPDNFTLPASGRLKLGNETASPTYLDYTGGAVSSTGVFTCDQFSTLSLGTYERKEAYPVLKVGYSQSNVTDLSLSCTTPGIFPSRNGRILIDTTYYIYTRTTFDKDNSILTLKNLSNPTTGQSAPVTVSAGDDVILKKFIVLKSTGTVGSGNFSSTRLITNSIPIGDSKQEAAPIDIKLDSISDFNKYFSTANSEGVSVQSLITAGGGSTIFTNMKSLSQSSDAGEDNTYMQGSFIFKDNSLKDAWTSAHTLDYDMQVKLSSYNSLMYASPGLEFRKKKVKEYNGTNLYQGFGISFMKYYSPALKFKNGKKELKNGDVIYYYGPSAIKNTGNKWTCSGDKKLLAKAQVDGAPQVTSGSWNDNNAKGIVMLKNTSLEVYDDVGYHLASGDKRPPDLCCYAATGVTIINSDSQEYAELDEALHNTEGHNDYIPNSIKPAGMGTWLSKGYYPPSSNYEQSYNYPAWNDSSNEGDRLLLVLWQQKVEGNVQYRRLLAYKDMTHDTFIKGKQDTYDGRVVNDETCLLLRIREGYSGTTKINKINIFYGDSSRLVNYSTRTKNMYKYDILKRRMAYWGGFKLPDQSKPTAGWSALWPPRNLVYWASSYNEFDYFSHIEKPDTDDIPNDAPLKDPDAFQWDYMASTTGTIESWDTEGTAIFTLDDSGTITISDFTTPDSGSYDATEIGLGAFFNSANSVLVSFSDFSIRILDPGYAYGAFISSVQS